MFCKVVIVVMQRDNGPTALPYQLSKRPSNFPKKAIYGIAIVDCQVTLVPVVHLQVPAANSA